MQKPDNTDAPLVPHVQEPKDGETTAVYADGGGRPTDRPFDPPPRIEYASEFTRDEEEIEPFVADLR